MTMLAVISFPVFMLILGLGILFIWRGWRVFGSWVKRGDDEKVKLLRESLFAAREVNGRQEKRITELQAHNDKLAQMASDHSHDCAELAERCATLEVQIKEAQGIMDKQAAELLGFKKGGHRGGKR